MNKWMRMLMMNADGGGAGGGGTDPGAGGGTDPGAGGGTDPGAGAGGGTDPGAGGGGNKQPFAVFPDEKSFMSRVDREAKKAQSEFLKSLGIENPDDLKAIVQNHKDTQAKNKTDLQKAEEARIKAEKDAADALGLVNTTLRNSEAKMAALTLGIKPERVDYALKLADLSAVEVKDGVVDKTHLTEVLNKVLTDMPELKGTTMPTQGGGDFNQRGGDGNGGKPPLSMELIKSMSTAETAERMDEILAFLAKQGK